MKVLQGVNVVSATDSFLQLQLDWSLKKVACFFTVTDKTA